MFATFLDIALAFIITRLFREWWQWLPLSLLAGGLLVFIFTLGLAVVDTVYAGHAITRGMDAFVTHTIFTALCAWAFASWVPSPPENEDEPQG